MSAYTQLCTGFAIGGITHAIAGSMATGHSPWQDPTGSIAFFLMQLLGVILEDVVLTVLQMARVTQDDCRKKHVKKPKEKYGLLDGQWRLSSWRQAFGYTFVVWWLSMTLPAYVEGLRKEGILETTAVPFSVIDWTVGRK